MLIDYIQKKTVDFKNIEKILQPSIQCNFWTNNGPVKQQLEEYLTKYLRLNSDKAVITVTSATAGLHLLMMYYKMNNPNFNWVSPSFTFPSVVVNNPNNVIIRDIELDTYTLPLSDKENEIYDGFIITNLFGTYPKNINEWVKYCKDNNKILLFDNASSPLTQIEGINICNFGDASIISFHPTKYLGAQCEAGAIVVDKDKYDIINSLTNFGFNSSREYNKYSSNFKLDDIRAAFQLNHLQNYDLERHLYNQNNLTYAIEEIKGVKVFNFNNKNEVLGNLCLEFDKPIDNKDFLDMGITCHKYYLPLNKKNHKNSMELYSRIINMPLNSSLTDFQLDFMIKQIKRKANE